MAQGKVEWLVGVLRIGSEFKETGDVYEASCTVMREGDHAKVFGLSGKMNKAMMRAIKNALVDEGIKTASWERKKNGNTLEKTLDHTGKFGTKV